MESAGNLVSSKKEGDPATNGLILSGYEIPLEIMENIIAFLPIDKLQEIEMVCRVWRNILRNPAFWRYYYNAETNVSWSQVTKHIQGRANEWKVHHAVCRWNVLGRNLLLNVFGGDSNNRDCFYGWNILSGDMREEASANENEVVQSRMGWNVKMEDEIVVRNIPSLGLKRCFVTDSNSCSKSQEIDLWQYGFTPTAMRTCIPFTITWGVYVGTPLDHAGQYELQVNFLSDSRKPLVESNHTDADQPFLIPMNSPFTYYGGSYTFNHGSDELEIFHEKFRYIHFYHGGMASDNDEGWNGPHIYRPMVMILLNSMKQ